MGDDADSLNRLYDTQVTLLGKFSDENFEKIVAYIGDDSDERLMLSQPGAWPEFLFKDSVITLEIEGHGMQLRVEDVSHLGLTLVRVPKDA